MTRVNVKLSAFKGSIMCRMTRVRPCVLYKCGEMHQTIRMVTRPKFPDTVARAEVLKGNHHNFSFRISNLQTSGSPPAPPEWQLATVDSVATFR